MPPWIAIAKKLADEPKIGDQAASTKLLPLWPWGQSQPAWQVILISQTYHSQDYDDEGLPSDADTATPQGIVAGGPTFAEIAEATTVATMVPAGNIVGQLTGAQIAPGSIGPEHYAKSKLDFEPMALAEFKSPPKVALSEEDAVPGDVFFDIETGFFYKVFEDGTHGPLPVGNLQAAYAGQVEADKAHTAPSDPNPETWWAVQAATALKEAGLDCKAVHPHFVAGKLPEMELVLTGLPKHKDAMHAFLGALLNPAK